MEYWTTGKKLSAVGIVVVAALCSATSYFHIRKQADDLSAAQAAQQAPAERKPGAQWSYVYMPVAGSDKKKHLAGVKSDNQVDFKPPFQGPQNAWLALRDDPLKGKAALLNLERGKFLCQPQKECDLSLRFDDAEPVIFKGSGNPEKDGTSVFINDYGQFLKKIIAAKSVRISLGVQDQGTPEFRFDLTNFISTGFEESPPAKAQ